MTKRQQEVREKYFTRWEYDFIPSDSSKEEYIERVGKLANVANKRAKTLKTAIAKGRISEDKTALFRYNDVVNYFNKNVSYNATFVSTGKKVYERMSLRTLKALELKLLSYLDAKSSTARGALEVESKRVSTFKERYGIDISKMPKKDRDVLFNTIHYLRDKNYKNLSSDQIATLITEAVTKTNVQQLEEFFVAVADLYPSLKDQAEFRTMIILNSTLSPKEKALEFKKAHELYKNRGKQKKPKYIKQEL